MIILKKRISFLTDPLYISAIFNWLFTNDQQYLLNHTEMATLKNIEIEQLCPKPKMIKGNKQFNHYIQLMNAFMNTPEQYSSCRRKLSRIFGSCFYFLNTKKAAR
jgi:hypothetical protein